MTNYQQLSSHVHHWNEIFVTLAGRAVLGLEGISVEHGYEHEVVYAAGSKPHGIVPKNHKVTGTVKMLHGEYEQFMRSQGSDYQLKSYDIQWQFITREGLVMVTHIIKGAKFGSSGMEYNQGDARVEIELPFQALDIELGR